jgi:hypothetical protein
VESLELEERKVWKHELKGKHSILLFILFFKILVLILVGAITNF